jgi:hypothetical protein
MNVKSVKRAIGLAVAAAGTCGAMMLAPAVANAATAQPAHPQAASDVWVPGSGWFSGDPSDALRMAPAPSGYGIPVYVTNPYINTQNYASPVAADPTGSGLLGLLGIDL